MRCGNAHSQRSRPVRPFQPQRGLLPFLRRRQSRQTSQSTQRLADQNVQVLLRAIINIYCAVMPWVVATRRMCVLRWLHTIILGLQVVATTAFLWCAQIPACISGRPLRRCAGLGCWHRASYSSFKGVWYEGQFAAVCTRQHSADRRQRRPQREDLHAMCSNAPSVMGVLL